MTARMHSGSEGTGSASRPLRLTTTQASGARSQRSRALEIQLLAEGLGAARE